jgi:1-acyl-sn-glycerol-3-phosphate acyltransferase
MHGGPAAIAARAGVPIVPMVIDGAFEAWPKTRRLPRPHLVRVAVGAPVMPPQYEGADAAVVMAEVRRRMVELQAELRGKPARCG